MKKLQKVRIIESPRTDLQLTMDGMLNVEGGIVCAGMFVTVEDCSDFVPSCITYSLDGLCNSDSSADDLYCVDHISI